MAYTVKVGLHTRTRVLAFKYANMSKINKNNDSNNNDNNDDTIEIIVFMIIAWKIIQKMQLCYDASAFLIFDLLAPHLLKSSSTVLDGAAMLRRAKELNQDKIKCSIESDHLHRV